jgi:hypothetical protein
MDLGFARRSRARDSAQNATAELVRLLAEIAGRQAVTPTAQALASADFAETQNLSDHREIDCFAPRADRSPFANAVSSFSKEAAQTILTHRKPL